MNIELLQRVKEQILAEPRRFSMSSWKFTALDDEGFPCGTAHCIGGWIGAFNDTNPPDPVNKAAVFRAVAGLPNTRLFFEDDWPEDLKDEYEKNWSCPDLRAKVAAKAIDSYIETNGWEGIGLWDDWVEDM